MKKTILVASLLVVAFTVGCGTTLTGSNDATHYRLLSDYDSIREIDPLRIPTGLHVKGKVNGLGFEPMADVEGRGKLCAQPNAVLSLRDGKVHEGTTSASGPHIAGCARGSVFQPASREVAGR